MKLFPPTLSNRYSSTDQRVRRRHVPLTILLAAAVLLSCNFGRDTDDDVIPLPLPETGEPPFVTEEIPPEPPTPTPIPGVQIGTLTLTPDGGTFEGDGISVQVSSGMLEEDRQIQVIKLDYSAGGGDADGAPQGYRLRGPLSSLTGVTITLPLMDTPTDGGDPYISLGANVFSPSAGQVYNRQPLPTQVDRANGTLSAVLDLTPAVAVGALPAKVAAPVPAARRSHANLRDPAVEVDFRQMRPPPVEQIVNSAHFSIHNVKVAVPEANLKAMLAILEAQRALIEELGFNLRSETGRLLVMVDELDPEVFGEFHPGILMADISINKVYLASESVFKDNQDEMTATAAHELLHWAQYLYDFRDPFTRIFIVPPTYSLDEASATWIEPLALKNPDYLPSHVIKNNDFVFSALLPQYKDASTKKVVEQRGYGASLFLRYLTKRFGSRLIPEFYVFSRAHGGMPSAMVLGAVLAQNEKSFNEVYSSFVELLMTRPGEIVAGLESPAVPKTAGAMAQYDLDPTKQDDYFMTFEASPSLNPKVTGGNDGKYKSGPSPVVKLEFSLEEASIDAFNVIVRESKPALELFGSHSQELKVAMNGEEGTLLFVFTQASLKGIFAAVGGGAARNQTLTVYGFGGDVKRVLIIPMAASLDGYLEDLPAPKKKTVSVELTLPVRAAPLEPFDCSCLDAIYPVGRTTEFQNGPVGAPEGMFWDQLTITGGFTWDSDLQMCTATRDVAKRAMPKDPYVFAYKDQMKWPLCAAWAKCNGKKTEDGCPYPH